MTDDERDLLYAVTDLILMLIGQLPLAVQGVLRSEIQALQVLTDPLEQQLEDKHMELLDRRKGATNDA